MGVTLFEEVKALSGIHSAKVHVSFRNGKLTRSVAPQLGFLHVDGGEDAVEELHRTKEIRSTPGIRAQPYTLATPETTLSSFSSHSGST